MQPEQITVVVPTFRRPRLLARALQSVLRHGYPDLRVRVFDNASGDETEAVVQAFSARLPIRYHRHSTNIGYANIQHAINAVDTEFVAILNDDDIQLPGLISNAMAAHNEHPSIGAYCGLTLVYDDHKHQSIGVQGRTWRPGYYPARTGTPPMVREHLTPTGIVFATNALREARFEFSDSEMMARLSHAFDIVVEPKITGAFSVHPGSWTQSRSFDDEQRLAIKAIREFLALDSLTTDDQIELILRVVRNLTFRRYNLAHSMMNDAKQWENARRTLGQSDMLLAALDGQSSGPQLALRAVRALLAWKSPAWTFRFLKRVVDTFNARFPTSGNAPRSPPADEAEAVATIAMIEHDALQCLPDPLRVRP